MYTLMHLHHVRARPSYKPHKELLVDGVINADETLLHAHFTHLRQWIHTYRYKVCMERYIYGEIL